MFIRWVRRNMPPPPLLFCCHSFRVNDKSKIPSYKVSEEGLIWPNFGKFEYLIFNSLCYEVEVG